jgi:hypothetical protein
MGFQVILTNLEFGVTHFHIVPTFHGTAIDYHDLKIIDDVDVTIDFLGNVAMDKIMGATTIHKDDDFPIFDVNN